MKKSTTPPTAAAMVVPGLNREKQRSSAQIPQTILNLFNFIPKKNKQIQIDIGENVAHPVLVSMGHPLSSITVQLKQRNAGCEIILIVCASSVCACACVMSTHGSVQLPLHSRQCPVALLYFHTVC